jgi:hypothetical protein
MLRWLRSLFRRKAAPLQIVKLGQSYEIVAHDRHDPNIIYIRIPL